MRVGFWMFVLGAFHGAVACAESGDAIGSSALEATVELDRRSLNLSDLLYVHIAASASADAEIRIHKVVYPIVFDPMHFLGSLPLAYWNDFIVNSATRNVTFEVGDIQYNHCRTVFAILKDRSGVVVDIIKCRSKVQANQAPGVPVQDNFQLKGDRLETRFLNPKRTIPIEKQDEFWDVGDDYSQ